MHFYHGETKDERVVNKIKYVIERSSGIQEEEKERLSVIKSVGHDIGKKISRK